MINAPTPHTTKTSIAVSFDVRSFRVLNHKFRRLCNTSIKTGASFATFS